MTGKHSDESSHVHGSGKAEVRLRQSHPAGAHESREIPQVLDGHEVGETQGARMPKDLQQRSEILDNIHHGVHVLRLDVALPAEGEIIRHAAEY